MKKRRKTTRKEEYSRAQDIEKCIGKTVDVESGAKEKHVQPKNGTDGMCAENAERNEGGIDDRGGIPVESCTVVG